MQVDLVERQPVSGLQPSCLDPISKSNSDFRVFAIKLIAALLILSFFSSPAHCVDGEQQLYFQKLFHLVGIPGLRRDERVNLTLASDGLVFQTKKMQYEMPYGRIHKVLLMRADRRYEGRTYAAALATYGVGSLFILKKHHVDTVVLDCVNEHRGKMGIVLQMETAQGAQIENLLKSRGVSVTEQEGTDTEITGGNRQ